MAIVENRVTEEGDVLIIETHVPIVGLVTLSSFIDTTIGEDSNKYFRKEFRYSIDGLDFSAWILLTDENLQSVPVNPSSILRLEYRYIGEGTFNEGDFVAFENINVSGEYEARGNGPAFDDSIFKYFFFNWNDPRILGWAINVLEKIYTGRQVVPTYICRGEDNNLTGKDRDFLDLFKSLCHFWALHVAYAREFENLLGHRDLLQKFLENRGLFISVNQTISELRILALNYFDEMRKRGTLAIIQRKGDLDSKEEEILVDGELLRLLSVKDNQEFLFDLSTSKTLGWNISNWSPLYRGVSQYHTGFNKLYEDAVEMDSLDHYPLVGESNITIQKVDRPFSMTFNSANEEVGIKNVFNGLDLLYAPVVDSSLGYRLSFIAKGSGRLIVQISAFTPETNVAALQPTNPGLPALIALDIQDVPNDWRYYEVIIYPFGTDLNDLNEDQKVTSVKSGTNFIMAENVGRLSPSIYMPPQSSGSIEIYSVKFGLLSTPYSTGFIGADNFVQLFTFNNSPDFNNDQIRLIMLRYLLSFNTKLQNNFLDEQNN